MTNRPTDVNARVPYSFRDREPWLELDVPMAEFRRRVSETQQLVAAHGFAALAVYARGGEESNVRYLSGFSPWWGEAMVMVPQAGEPVLLTNAIFHGEPMHSNLQTTWFKDIRRF